MVELKINKLIVWFLLFNKIGLVGLLMMYF